MLLEAGFDAVHVWLRPIRQHDSDAGLAIAPDTSSSQLKNKSGNGRRGTRRTGGNARRGEAESDDSDDEFGQMTGEIEPDEVELKECVDASSFTSEEMQHINLGWIAYLVAVVNARPS